MVPQSLNNNIVCGFFDTDGSFSARVYSSKKKPLGMSLRIGFSQKNISAIEMVLKTLGAKSNSLIHQRTHSLSSGNKTITNSKEFAFSTPTAKVLLAVWENEPPKSPTKYLDYKICIILDQAQKNEIQKVQQLLPNETVNLRVACFSLLYLRYQMFGKIKHNKHPKLIPITDHYTELKATSFEIKESTRIGKLLLDIVQLDVANHVSNLSINESYLLGYHIGDGSFSFTTYFDQSNKTFRASFVWNVTDCIENKVLLEAIKQFLESKGIYFCPVCFRIEETYLQLQVTTMPACTKLVDLFDQWGARTYFSKVRLNQFECFSEALKLYQDPTFRDNLSMCERFIDLKWKINPNTNNKKKGSLAEDLIKIRAWFNNKD